MAVTRKYTARVRSSHPTAEWMGASQRAEITRKMHEKGSSACLQRASMGRKQGNSLQPKRRYSAINSKCLMAANQDTFVSAQESSKLCFTKCLFFALRNTTLCQMDTGMSWVIIPAKIAAGLMRVSCKRRGRSTGCQLGKQSSRHNLRGTVLGMAGQDSVGTQRKIGEMWGSLS